MYCWLPSVGEPCPRPPGYRLGSMFRVTWEGTCAVMVGMGRGLVVVILLEPFHQLIYTAMSLVPVPESIWGDTHIFDLWFPCWLIGQHELPRILL